jgi:tripartite-type tricarboxylate transporter receptor subunit TctC
MPDDNVVIEAASTGSRPSRRLLLAAAASLPLTTTAGAQGVFPNRPVRLIVPAPPGGAIDITARLLAARLLDVWSQPVVVENRAGANNIIGTEAIARAVPDGHTIGITAVPHAFRHASRPDGTHHRLHRSARIGGGARISREQPA